MIHCQSHMNRFIDMSDQGTFTINRQINGKANAHLNKCKNPVIQKSYNLPEILKEVDNQSKVNTSIDTIFENGVVQDLSNFAASFDKMYLFVLPCREQKGVLATKPQNLVLDYEHKGKSSLVSKYVKENCLKYFTTHMSFYKGVSAD